MTVTILFVTLVIGCEAMAIGVTSSYNIINYGVCLHNSITVKILFVAISCYHIYACIEMASQLQYYLM